MIKDNLNNILGTLPPELKLVAVSKFHPLEAILEAYDAGQRLFGESRPQELSKKVAALQESRPEILENIEWHFIGHLQTNKLKFVLPYAHLVQSVDSTHLLDAINAWGKSAGKKINVLLEMHVAAEESKQGFAEEEILDILFRAGSYSHINFCGLMGMATFTDDEECIRADFARISDYFAYLKDLFPELESFKELSIGMSSDYLIAMEYDATIVRVGTSIFGERQY